MATQEDLNAVVAALQDDEAGIAAVDQKVTEAGNRLQAEIDQLAQANPALDLTALQAIPGELRTASDALGAHVDAVGNLTPTPPAPPA